LGLVVFLACLPGLLTARQSKVDVLRIGTSGSLTADRENKEKGALESLKNFIKEQTGLKNDIARQKDWRELTDKMAKGDLHIGVYQGFEFAWATENRPELKPLALSVNVYRYPIAYVVTRKDNQAKDFAALQGQSICLPDTGQAFLRLYLDSQTKGKGIDGFFSKVTTQQGVEDALDDVVDGVVQAAAIDRAALEAYKQRKPGRFDKLKKVAESAPFPPAVIAYYDKVLDDATLKTFKDGLLGANKTEKGKAVLTEFHLTGFDAVPDDFAKVLADTRKEYPPPKADKK
jgi:ABC-type phosphate/phosphonate transport system substrate-binding protein